MSIGACCNVVFRPQIALFLLAVYFIMDVTLHTTNNHGALSVLMSKGKGSATAGDGASSGAETSRPGRVSGPDRGPRKGAEVRGALNGDMMCAAKIFANASFIPTDAEKPCATCTENIADDRYQIRVYVVGHSKYKDRQADISKMLAEYNIRGSYVRGFDAEEMPKESASFKCMCPRNYSYMYPRDPKKGVNRTLMHGGCTPHWRRMWGPPNAAAHYSVYNDVIANDYDAAFVIEDDTVLKGDRMRAYKFPGTDDKTPLGDILRKAFSYISFTVPGYDVVSVGGCFGRHGPIVGDLEKSTPEQAWHQKKYNDTLEKEKITPENMHLTHVPRDHTETARCSHGYLISKAGSYKLMRYGLPLLNHVKTGFDGIDIDAGTNEVYRQFGLDSWYLERPLACQTMGRPMVVRGETAC